MARAIWNDTVVAESETCLEVDGRLYFPIESVRREYLRDSAHRTACSWKGTASYYDVVVDGKTALNAAWRYADPKPAARQVAGRIAFWMGVEVER